jgi:hypothetical protein
MRDTDRSRGPNAAPWLHRTGRPLPMCGAAATPSLSSTYKRDRRPKIFPPRQLFPQHRGESPPPASHHFTMPLCDSFYVANPRDSALVLPQVSSLESPSSAIHDASRNYHPPADGEYPPFHFLMLKRGQIGCLTSTSCLCSWRTLPLTPSPVRRRSSSSTLSFRRTELRSSEDLHPTIPFGLLV